jgi:hypothetical protein
MAGRAPVHKPRPGSSGAGAHDGSTAGIQRRVWPSGPEYAHCFGRREPPRFAEHEFKNRPKIKVNVDAPRDAPRLGSMAADYRLNTRGDHQRAREGGVRTLIDRRLQARGARDAVWASLIASTTKAAGPVQESAATLDHRGCGDASRAAQVSGGRCSATAPARSPRRSDGAIQSDQATRDRTHVARGPK